MSSAVTTLTEIAAERSRYSVTLEVKNLAGDIVLPGSLKWTLTDSSGAIINNRDQVVIASPTASHQLLLYGNDLSVTESLSRVTRILLIEATYTEGNLAGIPYNHEYHFVVQNFVGISGASSTEPLLDADGNQILDADGNPIISG